MNNIYHSYRIFHPNCFTWSNGDCRNLPIFTLPPTTAPLLCTTLQYLTLHFTTLHNLVRSVLQLSCATCRPSIFLWHGPWVKNPSKKIRYSTVRSHSTYTTYPHTHTHTHNASYLRVREPYLHVRSPTSSQYIHLIFTQTCTLHQYIHEMYVYRTYVRSATSIIIVRTHIRYVHHIFKLFSGISSQSSALVAQWIARQTSNLKVLGSSPN